jgi:hypothetical protein
MGHGAMGFGEGLRSALPNQYQTIDGRTSREVVM